MPSIIKINSYLFSIINKSKYDCQSDFKNKINKSQILIIKKICIM